MKYGKINSPLNGNVNKGVMYATYSALIGESSQNAGKYKTRLKQLIGWCGDDFDGLIVFDECHRAKNLFPGSGGGNGGKPTKTGQTVFDQDRLRLGHRRFGAETHGLHGQAGHLGTGLALQNVPRISRSRREEVRF
jgi:hypothetical protein